MRTLIIAEAGVNHNGNVRIAKRLVLSAKKAGADFIKFQTFNPVSLTTKNANQAPYQFKNIKKKQSQRKMLEKLALTKNDFITLKKYSKKINIGFLSTAFDIESLGFLIKKCELKIIKIPSGEITNYPYLRFAGSLKKKIFLSTGMSEVKEIERAVKTLIAAGTRKTKITILHCTSSYPAPEKELNLKALVLLRKKFNIEVGYSDHSDKIETSVAAVALGAKVIEKHFTLNKRFKGPDHKSSIDVIELKKMVDMIRNTEKSLGCEKKLLTKSEKKNLVLVRKSIVALRRIKKGELFTEENITCKRPANGISPIHWKKVIGKKAKKNFLPDQFITI
tara:strand:+ start:936 stop:1940 length:1005 start_codon:yes stop_codon:yes gene_type:complete